MAHNVTNATVIICAYTDKRWDELQAAVASVQRQTTPPLEIIVVIDHNPALFERAHTVLPATVIENTHTRGLSGARNSGIALAQGDWLAFMDEDAVAADDWLWWLEASFQDPDVMGVGGAILPHWQNGRPRWFPSEFDWVVGCTYRGMPQTTQPVRNLIGCNMSFRRQVFDSLGGFRDGIGRLGTLPYGCEETEFCIRVQQRWRHARFLYEPEAHVHHLVPTQRATWAYFTSRCFAEGRSKAQVAQFVGAQAGLSSERTYTLRTLPAGITRGTSDAFLRRDFSGLGRAGAIIAGLATTIFGYATGRLAARRHRPEQKQPRFAS